ncbi:MAG: redoxin domain-containing protein [Saprospiraceae bacterium]|nr:redoxin domain-containing protein [Saprospiraceae bacterium]
MKKLVFLLLPFFLQAAKAPDFTVTDYNNKIHKLYQDYLDKEKVVIIKIFFVDCPPCNNIAPKFQSSYVKWGQGAGRVQFFEMSTMSGDVNSYVKQYTNRHGLTCPSIGSDGGSLQAIAPYKDNKTFGPYYGTPSFLVIAPNGEVNFNVPFNNNNTIALDSAITQALRIPSGGSGGGNKCNDSFKIKVLNPNFVSHKVITYDRYNNSNPKYELPKGDYNCEFFYPPYRENYVVGIEAPTLIGDYLNGVSTADIVILQKFILRIKPINNLQYNIADVNGNGTVSTSDIAEIRKLILGASTSFKNGKNIGWAYDPKGTDNTGATSVSVTNLLAKKNNEFAFGYYGDLSGAANPGFASTQSRASCAIPITIQITAQEDGRYYYEIMNEEDIRFIGFQMMLTGANNEYSDLYCNSNIPNFNNTNVNFYKHKNNNFTDVRVVYASVDGSVISLQKNSVITSFYAKKYIPINPYLIQEFITENSESCTFEYETKLMNNNFINFSHSQDRVTIETGSDIEHISLHNIQNSQLRIIRPQSSSKIESVSTLKYEPGIYIVRTQLCSGYSESKKMIIIR